MTKENQSWIAGNQGRNPHVVWMLQTVTNRPEATKYGHEFVMHECLENNQSSWRGSLVSMYIIRALKSSPSTEDTCFLLSMQQGGLIIDLEKKILIPSKSESTGIIRMVSVRRVSAFSAGLWRECSVKGACRQLVG